MRLNRRVSLTVLSGIGLSLTGVLLFDVYEDWAVQGNTLASTAVENALPFVLLLGLFYTIWELRGGAYSDSFVESVTLWTVAGAVTTATLVGWVVGIQNLQNELKPWIIVLQTTVVGTGAGVLVGRRTATVERARERSERERVRFESLFENDPAAIADLRLDDDDGFVIEAVNPEYETQFGAVSDDGAVLPALDEEAIRAFEDAADARERHVVETTHYAPEGRKRYVVQLVPYGGDADLDGIRGYLLYRDVTEVRETEMELERTVEQLERSNEQLQQFAYVASHDLQEPLRMVSSYVDLLASEYGDELDDEADEYIEFAVDGAQRMQAMIDDLLEYSRVHTQGESFEEVDAEVVLGRVLQDLELLIAETDATVTHDDLPRVVADENQLRQLFQNLLSNAIEHGADGDGPPTVHVSGEDGEDAVVFSVSDDGPGIPADQQERVFELFEQSNRDDEGTGIGLAICQRIVNRHEGDIWIESTPGDGATFHASFPKR
jgi:signal transduction histidine kinase